MWRKTQQGKYKKFIVKKIFINRGGGRNRNRNHLDGDMAMFCKGSMCYSRDDRGDMMAGGTKVGDDRNVHHDDGNDYGGDCWRNHGRGTFQGPRPNC